MIINELINNLDDIVKIIDYIPDYGKINFLEEFFMKFLLLLFEIRQKKENRLKMKYIWIKYIAKIAKDHTNY